MQTAKAEDFKTLFEQRCKTLSIKEGDLLSGKVVSILRDFVTVDVGFKSEGLVPSEEFKNFEGVVEVKPGDPVEVVVEQIEDQEGMIVLSKERADAVKSWDRVEKVFEKDEVIDGVVINKIKGGMSVNLGGIKAFLPASQIDLKPIKSLDKLINQKYSFKILKLNKAKGNIVLSRRIVLEKERESQKQELLSNLQEGQVIKGVVKNLTDYGAFVDLGGVDGLLHITDMTWGRAGHPSEIFKIGQEIEVVVLKYDQENSKVSLGYKQLKDDPWNEVDSKFTPGERIKGKVVNLTDYGVFVEIADGIEGLVHVSELTWSKKVKHPSKIVKIGDQVEAVILDVDKQNRRISLGIKQLEVNPWIGLEVKYPSGTKIKGVVRNITDFGVFVGIEGEEIDGLVHISDLSWDKNIKHPSELVKKGQEVDAVVLSVDKDNERFALGMKQLQDNPMEGLRQKYSVGKNVTGTIAEIQDKGMVVTLEENMQGFISNIELSSQGKVNAKEVFKVGDPVTAQVKKFDDRSNQVSLSIKAYEKKQEKKDMKDFLEKQGTAAVTLKDAFGTKQED
ncbi:MAG TPA: 30S ribosomal protein S1 [Deltaproteobacteria bacterium]|nr:MAG: 30S ribosomal protein S1 [Deltaproteobacteria bacterium GWA2_45_12]HBF13418.1 30S ribosomal protein S1 [Deltaproteobacteria bacterium]